MDSKSGQCTSSTGNTRPVVSKRLESETLLSLPPWVRKVGVRKLPGDLRFKLSGREFFLPFTSTVLLSLVAAALAGRVHQDFFAAAYSFGQAFFSASVHLLGFFWASGPHLGSVLAKALTDMLAKAAKSTNESNLRIRVLLN